MRIFRAVGAWQYDFPHALHTHITLPSIVSPYQNVCAHGSTAEESFIGTMSLYVQLKEVLTMGAR
jgi:hypothetical protein